MITVKATYDAGAICDSSGNYATAIGSNPNIIANWTAMSSVWDEYRVLAMTAHFKANTLVGGSSMVTLTPMVSVIDFDNSAALTGYTLAGYYSSNKEFKGGSSWKRTAYMSGAENAVFTSTISPSSYWWVKAYSSGNSASLNLGRFNVTYYVQFRGLGIWFWYTSRTVLHLVLLVNPINVGTLKWPNALPAQQRNRCNLWIVEI